MKFEIKTLAVVFLSIATLATGSASAAAPQCDVRVEPTIKKLTDDKTFKGGDPEEALRECRNAKYENCQSSGSCKQIGWGEFGFGDRCFATGQKYKIENKSKEQVRFEKCSKLDACEERYLNDAEVTPQDLEKLLILKKTNNC